MSLEVTALQHSPEVLVVRVGGVAEERPLLAVVDDIEAAAQSMRCVVVDVDELVLFSANAVRSFVRQLLGRFDDGCVMFTARRRTARRILRRWGGNGVVIVDSPDDAHTWCSSQVA
jgi:hypothetical protein